MSQFQNSNLLNRLEQLPDHQVRLILFASCLLSKIGKWDGSLYHRMFQKLMKEPSLSEDTLCQWIDHFLFSHVKPATTYSNKQAVHNKDCCLRQSELAFHSGISCVKINMPPDLKHAFESCPAVLFVKGDLRKDTQWVSIFNSRHSKQLSPDAPWLSFLRSILPKIKDSDFGIAGSVGTLIYDLTSYYASGSGIPLLAVLPYPIEKLTKDQFFKSAFSLTFLSCQHGAAVCHKAKQMVCRDRLLAFLSDYHLILDIRRSGNLNRILTYQQQVDPKIQWGYVPLSNNAQIKAESTFLEICQKTSKIAASRTHKPVSLFRRNDIKVLRPDDIHWKEYLFHYTRSCAGPWIGQSYESYLQSLLDNDPLSGHTGVDTLIRILTENRIRASGRLIRGQYPVVSFTSEPPYALHAIRRWNPALIRWTFEPYGIAIRRKWLKQRGCMPAIYGSDAVYSKLKQKDRFRFQKKLSNRVDWRREKEWRLPLDIDLTELSEQDCFLFVNSESDVSKLEQFVPQNLPCLVLMF